MQKRKYLCLSIILLFTSTGCLMNNIDWSKLQSFNNKPQNEEKLEDKNGVIPKVVDSLKDANKEDCITLYKMYRGFSTYVEHATSIKNTSQLFPPTGVIKNVREDYGWSVSKYPRLSEVVKSDLMSYKFKNSKNEDVGLDDVQELKPEVKDTIVKVFKLYAEGCRQAALKQK